MHPSGCPNESIKHADSVVIGEAEISWPKLLDDLEKGKLKKLYKSKQLVDMSRIVEPKREALKIR